jgi:hypothetical protein
MDRKDFLSYSALKLYCPPAISGSHLLPLYLLVLRTDKVTGRRMLEAMERLLSVIKARRTKS